MVYLAKVCRKVEINLVETLKKIKQLKVYITLGHTSLFTYVVNELGLSEAQAYALCAVTRSSDQYPPLAHALHSGRLTVHRASRIVSALNESNAQEIIEYACTHTSRETERFIVQLRPRAAKTDRVRPLASQIFELRADFARAKIAGRFPPPRSTR